MRPEINSVTDQQIIKNNRGQAAVEYILILLITVGLVVSLSLQFIKPFKQWADFYLGDYIYCLLDEGELPVLGGESDTSECDKNFDSFTVANGRPSNNAQNQSSNSSSSSSKGESFAARNARAGGANASSGSGGRSRGVESDAADKKTTKLAGSSETQYWGGGRPGSSGAGTEGKTTVISTENLSSSQKKRLKEPKQKTKTIGAVDEEAKPPTKKMVVKPPERKIANQGGEIEEFSLGKIFRIALIILVIIAIIFFLGSQALQISKSMEK